MKNDAYPGDFTDLLELLGKHHVRYVLVGGLAVIYHGHGRTTGDMDLHHSMERHPVNGGERVRVVVHRVAVNIVQVE